MNIFYLIQTLILLVLSSLSSIVVYAEDKVCTYGAPTTCPKDSYCIKYEQGKDVCINKFQKVMKIVSYPFKSSVSSFCDQGPLSPPGNSHTWNNTAYALDIKSYSKENVDVIAGVDGTVIAYDDCKTRNDQCGQGFGNQVKILTEDNFIVFYAHLKKIGVKTGDIIKAGTVIGLEGQTGWTGKDNKHLHLSVHYDWRSASFEYWKNVGYLPSSVPFQINDCEGKIVSVENLKCKRVSETPYEFCSKPK
jgi:hypothetical protein